jgi:hypothetical protein
MIFAWSSANWWGTRAVYSLHELRNTHPFVQSPPNSFGHDGLTCHVSPVVGIRSRGVLGIGVARGSLDTGFEMLGSTWGVCMFAWWVRKSWRVTCKSAKLLSSHRIRASASEMGEVSGSMGFGWYGSGGKFAGGSEVT